MFSDDSNKYENYTYVRTKLITLKKYKCLSGHIHLYIYMLHDLIYI